MREQMKKLEAIGRQLAVAPDQQVSLTDPDARSMATRTAGCCRPRSTPSIT